jgi:hypothetical protein
MDQAKHASTAAAMPVCSREHKHEEGREWLEARWPGACGAVLVPQVVLQVGVLPYPSPLKLP